MAKSKSKIKFSSALSSVLAIITGLLTSLALFLNVWVWDVKVSGGITQTEVGGYFEDFKLFEALFVGEDKLATWGSTLAGVAVIIALVALFVYIIVAVCNMIGKCNKTLALVGKLACYVMIICSILALVGTCAFVVLESKIGAITYSMSMGFGAVAGMVFPVLSGILGLVSLKK